MIGDKVKIIDTNEVKIISDTENIEGVDIFYMSDGTSYSSLEFTIEVNSDNKFIVNQENLISSILNSKQNQDASKVMMERLRNRYIEEYGEKSFFDRLKKNESDIVSLQSKYVKKHGKKALDEILKIYGQNNSYIEPKKTKSISIFGWKIPFSKSK